MIVKITHRTALKIRQKHGLDWEDVATIFEDGGQRFEYKSGDTGISFGITKSGKTVTVITIRKENVNWVKTAREMTGAEKKTFRKSRR